MELSPNSELNFHQIRIFHSVARLGSFSRAAEALDISQPAVSIQVQDLEKSLNIALLHRKSRGLQLTEAGEIVYGYAQRIFSLSSEMQGAIQDIHGLNSGHLIIGASTTPGEYVLPVAIGRFLQQYPHIQVELKISNTRTIVNQILQRELDMGMIGSQLESNDGELETSTYVMDEIVLVTSPSHPIAKQRRISLSEVMEAGLVLREEGSATRQAAEECFARLGVEQRIAIELGSNQAVKLAAQTGVGIGVISQLGIAAELKAGLLCVLPVNGWRCTRPLTLAYLRERRLSPAQRAFLGLLESERPLP